MTSMCSPTDVNREQMICDILENYRKHGELVQNVSDEMLRLYWVQSNSLVTGTIDVMNYNSQKQRLHQGTTALVHQYENGT